MLAAMRLGHWVLLLTAGGVVAGACGGNAEGEATEPDGAAGVAGTAGSAGTGATGGTPANDAGKDARDSGKHDAKRPDAGWDGWVDPGCPDAAPLPPQNDCDPFASDSGCQFGEGCYPWIDYPTEPCAQQQFGTICAPAGNGTQGDPCGGGPCASGHSCVITGEGTQCVQLCALVGPDTCPPGLFCVPTDVEGYGGCF